MKNITQYLDKTTPTVLNSKGAEVFKSNEWIRLKRFLMTGQDTASYHIAREDLKSQNVSNVKKLINQDGISVVDFVVDYSLRGVIPKNDTAILVLALCASAPSEETRKYALSKLGAVCRTGTHLFQFVEFTQSYRGWGKTLKKAIGEWYLNKTDEKLVFQLIKYQQRNGWSHKDLLRLSHPKGNTYKSDIFKWVTKSVVPNLGDSKAQKMLEAFEMIKMTSNENEIIKLALDNELPMEVIPTEKQSNRVWEAMIPQLGMTWILRNLNNMTKRGILTRTNDTLINFLKNLFLEKENLRRARLHPMQIIVAKKIYEQGKGERGTSTWSPIPAVSPILDDAFYLSFETIETTNKKHCLALDVSGSMTWKQIPNMFMTPREVSAVMSMVTARTEPNHVFIGFSSKIIELPIKASMDLKEVMKVMHGLPYGGTDCALPLIAAEMNKFNFDIFAIYTDNETRSSISPIDALDSYQKNINADAKLAVIAMESNGFTIADPNRSDNLDIAGFSSDTPALVSAFVRGDL